MPKDCTQGAPSDNKALLIMIENKPCSPSLFGRVEEFLKVMVLRGKFRKRYFPSINQRGYWCGRNRAHGVWKVFTGYGFRRHN